MKPIERIILYGMALVILLAIGMGAWDNDKPADLDAWNDAAGYIRANNDALEVELGIDLAEAHPYFQSAAPAYKPDGSTALDVDDNGRMWIDSDDNSMYVLTDYSGPTWTSLSAAADITESDATFTLQNTDEEDSDGGRQSRYISKGEQSGGEDITLGYVEFSHDGTSDDQKGQFAIKLNDGNDDDAPSKQPIGYLSTGKIDVSSSLSVLDEDNMTSDDDEVLATQQSIKAYIDNLIASDLTLSAYTSEDSDSTTMIKAHAYLAATAGQVTAFDTVGNGETLSAYVGTTTDPAGAGDQIGKSTHGEAANIAFTITFLVAEGEYFEITFDGSGEPTIFWKSFGTLSKPADQD